MAQLEIKKLRSGYGTIPILHDISLQVEQGEIIAVIGSNGAGKTTLVRTISGLIEPLSGEIIFNGESITRMPPHKVVATGVAQVPEGRQLFNFLTVEENLMMGSNIAEARAHRKESLELVLSLFPVLAERKDQEAGTLSGGEQQMLATARGMMARPSLLMMDEPSWGLAPMLTKELFEVIERVNKEVGTTIMLVEQNVFKALSIANHAYVLERGNVVMEGTGQELLDNKELKTAYLGL
ncbi:MAG: ABC transporter ATP-binding protein [Dehalococcoidia bacterium]|nr:ABC transporter ATP-binding protein [Dehalococcoidia bacterium]